MLYEHQSKFRTNAVYYLDKDPPPSFISCKISIIGAPLSGKTTLAQNIAKKCQAVYLNKQIVIEMILEMNDTNYYQQLKQQVYQHDDSDDSDQDDDSDQNDSDVDHDVDDDEQKKIKKKISSHI